MISGSSTRNRRCARSGWPQAQGCEECQFMSFWLTRLEGPPKILEVGIWVDHGDSFKAMCQGLLQGLFDGQAGACGAGPWTSMKNPLYFPSCSILALLSGWWRWFGFFLFSPKCWDGGCWWFVFLFYFPQPDWDDDPI